MPGASDSMHETHSACDYMHGASATTWRSRAQAWPSGTRLHACARAHMQSTARACRPHGVTESACMHAWNATACMSAHPHAEHGAPVAHMAFGCMQGA
eukprot:356209-Chlamydomonas_euryale.AAC.5